MKTIFTIGVLLFTALGHAQFLDRLGDRAVNAAERTVERRVEREATKSTDRVLDTIVDAPKNKKKKARKKRTSEKNIIGGNPENSASATQPSENKEGTTPEESEK